MKTVEYWIWRYTDPKSGRMCRTMFPMSATEVASRYQDAEPIEGTRTFREVYDTERDTVWSVFRHAQSSIRPGSEPVPRAGPPSPQQGG